jgi:hypothetical protein
MTIARTVDCGVVDLPRPPADTAQPLDESPPIEQLVQRPGKRAAVPEPASLKLVCLGVTSLLDYGWRRKRAG